MNIATKGMTEEELERLKAEHERLNPEREIKGSILDALDRYVIHGIMPGGFLTAVLCNDLFGAFGKADSYNRASLFQITQHIYNNLPRDSWGSKDRVSEYSRRKTEDFKREQDA